MRRSRRTDGWCTGTRRRRNIVKIAIYPPKVLVPPTGMIGCGAAREAARDYLVKGGARQLRRRGRGGRGNVGERREGHGSRGGVIVGGVKSGEGGGSGERGISKLGGISTAESTRVLASLNKLTHIECKAMTRTGGE